MCCQIFGDDFWLARRHRVHVGSIAVRKQASRRMPVKWAPSRLTCTRLDWQLLPHICVAAAIPPKPGNRERKGWRRLLAKTANAGVTYNTRPRRHSPHPSTESPALSQTRPSTRIHHNFAPSPLPVRLRAPYAVCEKVISSPCTRGNVNWTPTKNPRWISACDDLGCVLHDVPTSHSRSRLRICNNLRQQR